MKTKLAIIIAAALACAAFAAIAPSAITFTVGYSGSPSASDIRTAKWAIAQENARRKAADPNAVMLTNAPAAALKASYLVVLSNVISNFHIEASVKAADSANSAMTEEQLRDINAAITDKLQSGMTPAQILQLLQ